MRTSRAAAFGTFLLSVLSPGLVLAQASAERPVNPVLTFLVTLAPLLLLFWLMHWYLKRVGIGLNKQHVERSFVHMEKIEGQNVELLDSLKRIEGLLRDR